MQTAPLRGSIRGFNDTTPMTEPILPLPAAPDALPEVAGYRVETLAGSGGMARVYRAIEEGLERPVAIKVLRPSVSGDAGEYERFERESRYAARLQHPHIVPIYRVARTAAGEPCIVMPWMAGTLADRPLPLAPDAARTILGELLDALAHAHAEHFVHRDLKPENVLFDAAGRAILADFGIAVRLGFDPRLTGEGKAVGSARYMSPEQVRGEMLDHRCDLYAVGLLAWELLTGRPPFEANDAFGAALAHLVNPIPRLPAELAYWQAWFDTALAKNAADRFADAGSMRAALPVAPDPDRTARRAGPHSRPTRARLRWLLAVIAAALVVAAWRGWLTRSYPDPQLTTQAQSETTGEAEVMGEDTAGPATAESPPAAFARWQDAPDTPWMVSLPATLGGAPRALSQSEISEAEFQRFLTATRRPASACARPPAAPPVPANHPATCVSHADARAYAQWLSSQTGHHYRLPSVAEWRAITVPLRQAPPTCASAWLSLPDCMRETPASSDSGTGLGAGWFGLIGNVREWTDDCAWQVERGNALGHGLRNTGRWLQGKQTAPRETRTCVGRRVVGSGYASTQPWPAAVTLHERDTRVDVGFRLMREGKPPAPP